jgi:hypothetical protein
MKLILHHLRKDIHAQRWLLLLLGLVLVLKIGVDALEIQPDYQLARTAEFVRSTTALSLTGAILWTALIVRLIQSEPVSGTGSFWLTRPVPRGVYVPSKLIFIPFLLILPYAVPTPFDMLRFLAAQEMAWNNLKSSVILQILLALIVLWLATYTRSMSQFWMVAVSFTLAAIALFAGESYFRFFLVPTLNGPELWMSRCVMSSIIFFAGLFVSLLIEHTVRKTRAGFGLGVACVLAAVLAGFFWPFVLPSRLITFFSPSSFDSVTTKSTDYLPNWRDHLSWQFDSQANVWAASAPLSPVAASAVPTPIFENVSASFQTEGERPQIFPNQNPVQLNEAGQFDFTPAIKADLPDIQIANRPYENLHAPMRLFTLNSETASQLRNKTGTLTVTLFGHMQSLIRKAAIPLGDRALGRLPGEIIRVAWLPRAPQTYINVGDPSGDKPVLDVWSLLYEKRPSIITPVRYYLLVDPQTNAGTFLYDAQANRYASVNPFSSKSSDHTFLRLEGNKPLNRMVLYIYQLEPGDYFSASLRAPDFTMNPPP